MMFRLAWKQAQNLARRRPGTVLLALCMVAAVLALPIFLALVAVTARASVSPVRLGPEAVVFITRGTPSGDIGNAQERIRGLPGVVEVQWMARDAAWTDLGKRSAIPVELKSNPLPDVLVVRLAFGTQAASLERFVEELAKLPQVDGVQSDFGWYRRLEQWLGFATWLAFGALGIGSFVALLVLLGAARLLAAAVPEDIRVLHVLGAEPYMVRRPFALVGGIVLAAGLCIATGLALAGLQVMAPTAEGLARAYGLNWTIAWPTLPWIGGSVLSAGLLGAIVSAAGAHRTPE